MRRGVRRAVRPVIVALWLVGTLLSVGHAHAQSSVVNGSAAPLPRGARFALLPSVTAQARELSATPAQRSEAVRGLTFALRKRGYELLPSDEVDTILERHVVDGCRDAVTCDPALALQALDVDGVISLALWQRAGGHDQVFVHIRSRTGYGQAELNVGPSGIGTAAAQAFNQAIDDTLVPHDTHVRVESQPAGANVRIDQVLAGKTPLTVSLAPGNHLVALEASGYVSDAQYLEISTDTRTELTHSVKLARSGDAPTDGSEAASDGPIGTQSEPAADGGPSVANYVIAAVLGAVALPLLVNAVYAGARDGQCTGTRDAAGNCGSRAELGPSFWASLGVGIAAGTAATTILILQPITAPGESLPQGATLQWHHAF